MKLADALRTLADQIIDRQFRRGTGHGPRVEAQLDLFLETVSVLDYGTPYCPGTEITQITNDSRQVKPGAIFVAVKGAAADGNRFIPQAAAAGAAAVVTAQYADDPPEGVTCLIVKDDYLAYSLLCEAFYQYPTRALTGFAVTGTNGKTTSAMLLQKLLNLSGHPCGLLSTVCYDTGDGAPVAARCTTPEAGELFALLSAMRDNNLNAFAMEASSHALAQNRLGALRFRAAIFTNLTGDHLDYHHTMEEYFAVKCRLFQEHLAPGGLAVIHTDDPWGEKLAHLLPPDQVVSFGRHSGVWRIGDEAVTAAGSDFTLTGDGESAAFRTNLIGAYNITNIAGAVLALRAAALLKLSDAAELLARHEIAVPGRLERFQLPNGATVFVDYAHTDDALRNVLQGLRTLHPARILTVFGAGGDRDRTKRPRMGKAAAEYSDKLYLTSDNPRSEDPESILAMIAAGIPSGREFVQIPEREEAIRQALQEARNGDIVLIAGKGHENYQITAGVKRHCDDRETVRQWLAAQPRQ